MGKASSTKKVQRAARAGGRVSSGQRPNLLFPAVLTLIMVLGVSLVAYARHDRLQEDLSAVPQLGDHIHQAYGVNVCGEWKDPIPEFESKIGIHTHGDGVMHIHPFSQLGAGANATLGRFLKDAKEEGGIEVSLSDTKLDYLGEKVEEGKTKCDGVKDPQLLVAYWKNAADASALPEIVTGDFDKFRLTENGGAITIYYGDPDANIPLPESAANLAELGAADGGQSVPPPGGSSTTVPGETTTTAAGGSTTTTAAGNTTTTTAAN